MTTDFKCLHCDALVPTREIEVGWCDSCGKKVPDSIRCAVKKSAPVQTRDDYDEPKPGGGRRLLVSGLAFVSFLALLAVTVLKLA